MEIFVVPTASATGSVAAGILAAVIRSKPDAVLGVATGGSPLPIYTALANHRLDMSSVRAFALDEYVGLPAGHTESYAEVVRREVTERLHLVPANVAVPDGSAADPEAAAADYDAAIEEVPLRCITQVLGTILEARRLLLVVNGADKARILAAALSLDPPIRCWS